MNRESKKANPLTADAYKVLLKRFSGEPGVAPGLSDQETVDLLSYAIKNGKAEQDGLKGWVDAYRDGGLLSQTETESG